MGGRGERGQWRSLVAIMAAMQTQDRPANDFHTGRVGWRGALVALLTAAMLSGCYRWTERPPEELRALRPAGLRQAEGGEKRGEPPEEVKMVLRSGEVITLHAPFAITEVEAGQFRVTDAHTPVRTVPIDQVARVEEAHPDATVAVAVAVAIPVAVLTVVLFMLGNIRGGDDRSTVD